MIAILKLFTNPWALIAVVAIAAFFYGRHVEHNIGEAAQLRAQLAIVKSDRDIAQSAAAVADAQAAALAEDLSSRERTIDVLEAEIAAGPEAGKRPASATDLDRMFGHRRR